LVQARTLPDGEQRPNVLVASKAVPGKIFVSPNFDKVRVDNFGGVQIMIALLKNTGTGHFKTAPANHIATMEVKLMEMAGTSGHTIETVPEA
jgi:hypothetical protein